MEERRASGRRASRVASARVAPARVAPARVAPARVAVALGVVAACGAAASGCSDRGSSLRATTSSEVLPAEQRLIEARPGVERTVEESDLFRLDGSLLYLQNPTRGLTVVDVADPARPALRAQLASLVGKAGELYLRGDELFVVFEDGQAGAGRAEVAAVISASSAPSAVSRLDLPGRLVTSRLLGSQLYLVTSDADFTWVSSVSVADPLQLALGQQRRLDGESSEAHVTSQAVFVAQRTTLGEGFGTRVRQVDIGGAPGAVAERGALVVPGAPQGRFHLDAQGTTLRLVTFNGRAGGSNVYVLDFADPDAPAVLGRIDGLAPGEDLHGARFVGDRLYVVTYDPVVVKDPLFIVSLADPARPTVLGELEVPGWSDYVFPRGDRLLAVGRGDLGRRVAASLYDVSDPARPAELSRVEFGLDDASSEANTDFRGVRIIEAGVLGAPGLVAIPFTNNLHSDGICRPEHHVQLIDLEGDALRLRGQADVTGLARRTVPVGSSLYAITDRTVAALDVADRDAPTVTGSATVGDPSAPEECTPVIAERALVTALPTAPGCAIAAPRGGSGAPLPLLGLLGALTLLRGWRRRLTGSR